ncbi:MAG: nucleoside-diphosphate kinase [Elusimicrobiota bacterium]
MEKTLVLIKPDALKKRIAGKIISRFERVGLRLEEVRMIKPTREIVEKHYPDDAGWLSSIGEKTVNTYKEYNLDLLKDFDTADPLEIGKQIRNYLIKYITSGAVIAIVISGNHAVIVVRKMVGNTAPIFADLGTIRGDFSIDSPDLADKEKRGMQNLVHASGSIEEAKKEISLWFS